MSIDYKAQFKTITVAVADEMSRNWKNHRVYTEAKAAFVSAQRTEARGIDVAFATTGYGQYHVWTVERPTVGTYHGIARVACRACSYATSDPFTMEVINDMTEVCPACESGRMTFTLVDGTTFATGDDVSYCDRCNEPKAHTRNAIAGDSNSAYWCDECISEVEDVEAMTEVGEEAIAEMVAVKCVACAHVVTDKAVMARMWCVDTQCPSCGDGALLWDDGSLGFADDLRTAARAALAAYDALVADHAALVADGARDKHIAEAMWAIDEMAPSLAEALRGVLA